MKLVNVNVDASVCNDKQCWSNDKCRCGSKEFIGKGRWDKGFIWNPGNCKCDKSCDIGDYLDYENCKCRERLSNKLVEECSEDINGDEVFHNVTLNDYGKVRNPCTILYIALLS